MNRSLVTYNMITASLLVVRVAVGSVAAA